MSEALRRFSSSSREGIDFLVVQPATSRARLNIKKLLLQRSGQRVERLLAYAHALTKLARRRQSRVDKRLTLGQRVIDINVELPLSFGLMRSLQGVTPGIF